MRKSSAHKICFHLCSRLNTCNNFIHNKFITYRSILITNKWKIATTHNSIHSIYFKLLKDSTRNTYCKSMINRVTPHNIISRLQLILKSLNVVKHTIGIIDSLKYFIHLLTCKIMFFTIST